MHILHTLGFDLLFVPLLIFVSFSFITCGFFWVYLRRALALSPLHLLASLLPRGHVVPLIGMVLVQGCLCAALLRLCRCCSGCVL